MVKYMVCGSVIYVLDRLRSSILWVWALAK